MPRKAKAKKSDTPVAIAEPLEALKERLDLKTADQLPAQLPPPELELKPFPRAEQSPPEREVVTTPERNPIRHDPPANGDSLGEHTTAVMAKRPTGPRRRTESDPANLFCGESVRIDLMPDRQGDSYWIKTAKPFGRYKQNLAIAAGFDPIGDADTAHNWQASRQAVAESGKDLNVLATMLDDKNQRVGRGR